jgi:hypothetical protein
MGTAANCPAEVTQVMEISNASPKESPCSVAKIPNAKETDRYPKQMGTPAKSPRKNVSLFFKQITNLFPYDGHIIALIRQNRKRKA